MQLRQGGSAGGIRVVVIDDEPDIVAAIEQYFGERGVEVRGGRGGADLRRLLASKPCDLVLLDLGLPGESGIDLARELVANNGVPVIIMSGRGTTVDRVLALELGADDYVGKPFELPELLARVRTVLRRAARSRVAEGRHDAVVADRQLSFGSFRYTPERRELQDAAGQRIELTGGELQLLEVFLEHPNRILSRERILDLTHGRSVGPFDRSVDMQVRRLRAKIEPEPARPTLIQSVRGEGYRFCATVTRQ